MKRIFMGIFLFSILLTGCGTTAKSNTDPTWFAFRQSGKQIVYYYLSGEKTAQVGKLLGTFNPRYAGQNSTGWSTNMKFQTRISIYTLPGAHATQEVAVKLSNDGPPDIALAQK